VIDDLFPFDSGKLWAWSLTVDGTPVVAAKAATAGAPTVGLPAAPPVSKEGRVGGPFLSSMFIKL
jgi:hypothetical protein